MNRTAERILAAIARIFEYAGGLSHGNMFDQMLDEEKKRARREASEEVRKRPREPSPSGYAPRNPFPTSVALRTPS